MIESVNSPSPRGAAGAAGRNRSDPSSIAPTPWWNTASAEKGPAPRARDGRARIVHSHARRERVPDHHRIATPHPADQSELAGSAALAPHRAEVLPTRREVANLATPAISDHDYPGRERRVPATPLSPYSRGPSATHRGDGQCHLPPSISAPHRRAAFATMRGSASRGRRHRSRRQSAERCAGWDELRRARARAAVDASQPARGKAYQREVNGAGPDRSRGGERVMTPSPRTGRDAILHGGEAQTFRC